VGEVMGVEVTRLGGGLFVICGVEMEEEDGFVRCGGSRDAIEGGA
jgi:hypothetical protein